MINPLYKSNIQPLHGYNIRFAFVCGFTHMVIQIVLHRGPIYIENITHQSQKEQHRILGHLSTGQVGRAKQVKSNEMHRHIASCHPEVYDNIDLT
jgi:hypothetical protein